MSCVNETFILVSLLSIVLFWCSQYEKMWEWMNEYATRIVLTIAQSVQTNHICFIFSITNFDEIAFGFSYFISSISFTPNNHNHSYLQKFIQCNDNKMCWICGFFYDIVNECVFSLSFDTYIYREYYHHYAEETKTENLWRENAVTCLMITR